MRARDDLLRFGTSLRRLVSGSLKLKLTLVIISILGLTVGLAPWSAITMQQHQLLDASRQHLRLLHEMLQKTIVATCKLTQQRGAVQKVLEALRGNGNIEDVRLFDTSGLVLYASSPAERGQRLSTAELSRYYGHPDPIILHRGGHVVDTLVLPMFNGAACTSCHPAHQKILGILQVSLNLDPTWHQLAALRHWALVATLLALGVIVVGVWWTLTFLIDRPLQRMVTVMGRAERGDLGARVAVTSGDELGQLGGHFNDMISKLQSTRTELERYHQAQLARADRLATIGELAAAMAHEIRNPLTGISGALSVLGREFPADDPRRDVVKQTHLLIDRLNQSVENILLYSRPSLPQFQIVRLDDVVERTFALVGSEAQKARVLLTKDLASRRGGTGACPAVRADPQQIQQVLTNLILNAIQATPPGGQVCIRTCVPGEGGSADHTCIAVEDTGKGMTEEEAAKAFQPFFSTKPRGTGLGLPIAKQIIEQHHGRITVHSTPNKGTCVQIELPGHPDGSTQGA